MATRSQNRTLGLATTSELFSAHLLGQGGLYQVLPGGLPGSAAHPMPTSTHSSPHMGRALGQLHRAAERERSWELLFNKSTTETLGQTRHALGEAEVPPRNLSARWD